MFRQKKCMRGLVCLFTVMMLTVCSGCRFGTKIVMQTPPPDTVLRQFFDELNAGHYDACDQYLADNATFVFHDDSEYSFADTLMKEMTRHVSYEALEDPVTDNLSASQIIRISSMDYECLVKWMKENIDVMEDRYLRTTGRLGMDSENHYDVSRVLSIAIEEYAKHPDTVSNQVTVHYVFSEEQWKIKADPDFITALFGGVVYE